MIAPIARIAGRWVASALVTYGIVNPEYGAALDGDIAMVLGAGIGAAVEGWYVWAKRKGGET